MQFILPAVIIFVSFFGESIFGMGGGFISIPLLTILFGAKTAITFVLIFQLLMGVLAFNTRKYTDWSIAIPITISIVIGTTIGTFMLSIIDSHLLQKFLAVTIFVFLIKMIFFSKMTIGKHPTNLTRFITGLIGGWFQGITGTSSPIFAMFLSSANLAKSVMRATLIYIFFATSVVRVIISYTQHLFTLHILLLALPTLPFFFLAIFLGHHVHKKLNDLYYRYTIYIILFLSAIVLIFKK